MSIYAQRMFDLGLGVATMKYDIREHKTLPGLVCEYNTGEPVKFYMKWEDEELGVYAPRVADPLFTLKDKSGWSDYKTEDYDIACSVTRDSEETTCNLTFSISLKKDHLVLASFVMPYPDHSVSNLFFGEAKIALPEEQKPEPDCEKLLISNPTWFINDEGVSTKVGSYTLVIKPDKNSRRHVSRMIYDCYDEPTKFTCGKVGYNGEEMFIIEDADDVPVALVPYSNVAAILNNYNN